MADNQTDSIDESSLMWLAEAALGDGVAPDLLGILKNRAAVMAFLVNDERVRHRRFAHTELLNYFLSEAIVSAISSGETPKFVRRNIIGSDFLMTFSDVISSATKRTPGLARKFIDSCTKISMNSLSPAFSHQVLRG